MKTLELENYGVQEMNMQEMKEVDGGFIVLIIIGAVLLLGASGCRVYKPLIPK